MSFCFSQPINFCAYPMPQDNRCALPGIKFCRTYVHTRFGLNSDLSCLSAPLVRLMRCHKKRCILWPFILMSEFVFTCKYHFVTGESCIYIKVRNCNLMASCGFVHLVGNRVDQVQTIQKMSSV